MERIGSSKHALYLGIWFQLNEMKNKNYSLKIFTPKIEIRTRDLKFQQFMNGFEEKQKF